MIFIFSTTTDPYDTDQMATQFSQQYVDQAFSVGQCVCNKYLKSFFELKSYVYLLLVTI